MRLKETIQGKRDLKRRIRKIVKHLDANGIKRQKVTEIVSMKKQNLSKLLLGQWIPKDINQILSKIEKHYSLN